MLIKNIAELTDLAEQLGGFEQRIIELADKVGLSFKPLTCDHISVRCNQIATAQRWRQGFLHCGELLSENEINGRPICLFNLRQPLMLFGQAIDCVELPYPTKKTYRNEGWEHIELIIPCAESELHKKALDLLSDEGLRLLGIKIKCHNPKADGDKLPNPTLAITDDIVTIKFHPYSIRDVVASEAVNGT